MAKQIDVIPAGFFKDAVDPSDEEIMRWAYIKGAHYPPEMTQDWDLCVTSPKRADLLIRLAADGNCPNRSFFLSCLYLLIGDSVRSKGRTWAFEEASAWIARQAVTNSTEVETFLLRAKDLLAKPETFDYNKWCRHGYAYNIVEPSVPTVTTKPSEGVHSEMKDTPREEGTKPWLFLYSIILPTMWLGIGVAISVIAPGKRAGIEGTALFIGGAVGIMSWLFVRRHRRQFTRVEFWRITCYCLFWAILLESAALIYAASIGMIDLSRAGVMMFTVCFTVLLDFLFVWLSFKFLSRRIIGSYLEQHANDSA